MMVTLYFLLATSLLAPKDLPPTPPLDVPATRVLLPLVMVDEPAAFGMRWTSTAQLDNASEAPITVAGFCCEPYPGRLTVQSHQALQPQLVHESTRPGEVVYIPTSAADRIHISLAVAGSNGAVNSRFSVPIIREEAFLHGETEMQGLPVGSDSRTSVRLYLMDPAGQFTIDIFDEVTGEHLASEGIVLIDSNVGLFFPLQWQVSNLREAYPALANASSVKIRITPVPLIPNSNMSYWVLGSNIDNFTQQVQLFFPD